MASLRSAPPSRRLLWPSLSARRRLSPSSRELRCPRLSQAPPSRCRRPDGGKCRMGYRVAVVGATGNVGREMLQTLADRDFPADEVVALASERSVGGEISFGENATLKVNNLADFDFRGIDIVLRESLR